MFCAIVSHPADSVVSVLNKEKGSSASQVLMRLGFKGTFLLLCILGQVFLVFWGGFRFLCHFMLLMLYGLLSRCMERSVCSYHYDWYPDCTTVVHLRFCQGLFQTSSPTSTWNARISEEEAWSNWIDNSWTDCWLPQWWVSWNFYIFDYVENKLYTMSLLVVPSSHMRV